MLYRLLGARIGENVYFAPGVVISSSSMGKVSFGDSSSFGLGTKILCEDITVGKRVNVSSDCNFRGDGKLIIGDDVFIGVGCILDCKGELVIEDRVQLAPGVRVVTHDTSGDSDFTKPIPFQRTRIMERAYVGAGAILLPGITVGREAIIGAGAVVTRDVPPGIKVVGVPAKPLGMQHSHLDCRRAESGSEEKASLFQSQKLG
jgi:acetyltransferase-like isoleucine patch superfamily enzyme